MSITAVSTRGTGWSAGSESARSNDSRTASSAYCHASPSFWTKPWRIATVEAAPPWSDSSIAPAIGAAWMNVVRSVRNRPISSSGLMPPSIAGTASGRAGRRTSPTCSSGRPTGTVDHGPSPRSCAKPSARAPASRRRWPRATRRRSTISSRAPASARPAGRRRAATARRDTRSARRRTQGDVVTLPPADEGRAYVAGSPSANESTARKRHPRIGVLDPDRVGDRHADDPPGLGAEPPLADQEPGSVRSSAPSWARRAPRPTTVLWSVGTGRPRAPPRVRRVGAGTRSSRTARA